MFLKDVRTQVGDIAYDTPPVLNEAVTISRAWETMHAHHISTLAMADESGKFHGLLSSGDVTRYDMGLGHHRRRNRTGGG